MSEQNTKKTEYAQTYGGRLGGILPLLTMVVTIIILSILGMRSMRNLWCAGFVGMVVGLFVYKDKGRYQEAVFKGIGDPAVVILMSIFIASGVLSKVLSACHLADGLLLVMGMLKLSPALIPVMCFVIAALMSTASGSSSATLFALVPVLFPVGVQMGCNPALLTGALLSGAVFGDNLAPISDMTITSAVGVGAEVSDVVRSRIKYSLTAAVPAAVLFIIFGVMTTVRGAGAALEADSAYALNLLFLIAPILVVVLILMKVNFLAALFLGDVVGLVMMVAFGYTDISTLFSETGIIAEGIANMEDAVFLMALIMIVLSLTKETGLFENLRSLIVTKAKSERAAEAISALFTCISGVVLVSGLSNTAFCAPIVRDITKSYHIAKTRTANYVSGFSCAIEWLLPHAIGPIATLSLCLSSGLVDSSFSVLDFIPYNFFCMALIVVYWGAIFTGWGRVHENEDE